MPSSGSQLVGGSWGKVHGSGQVMAYHHLQRSDWIIFPLVHLEYSSEEGVTIAGEEDSDISRFFCFFLAATFFFVVFDFDFDFDFDLGFFFFVAFDFDGGVFFFVREARVALSESSSSSLSSFKKSSSSLTSTSAKSSSSFSNSTSSLSSSLSSSSSSSSSLSSTYFTGVRLRFLFARAASGVSSSSSEEDSSSDIFDGAILY